MNKPHDRLRHLMVCLLGLALLLMVTGCATSKINWKERIGHYTYDQAVMELGPPENVAKLTDGTVIGDWLISRGYSHGYVTGGGGYPYGFYGGGVQSYTTVRGPDYYLRLTFGPDGQLASSKEVTK